MFSFDAQKRTRKAPAISTRWIHEKGAARPFQTPKQKSNRKILAATLNVFFSLLHLESLRDGRRPTAAYAFFRNDLSREKVFRQ